jgi:putative glutathione S-transferase
MGLLVDGKWRDEWYDTSKSGGKFVRSQSAFRNWVTVEGAAGPTGEGGFKAEPGRYHLYVSLACPWAHRTLIFRMLKGLESAISISVVDWLMAEQGWTFHEREGVVPDRVNGAEYLWQVYVKAQPGYTGRVTVPVLWDKQRATIVSNESSEIIRMLNSAFDAYAGAGIDLYRQHLRTRIDTINERVYRAVNNGVYRCGFATTQAAYEEAFAELFETLDWLESLLAENRYVAGSEITEADWRLFTTLVRFDAVYFGHFKCNRHRIEDFPNLANYLRELYQVPGIAGTVDFTHIKSHYYASHRGINPSGIVPVGPAIDYLRPHDRERLTIGHQ